MLVGADPFLELGWCLIRQPTRQSTFITAVILVAQLNDRTPDNFARSGGVGMSSVSNGKGHQPSA
jgi:hypothetical protein